MSIPPTPTPEEALGVIEKLTATGMSFDMMPEWLATMAAGFMTLFGEAVNGHCKCSVCARMREMAETVERRIHED